MLHLYAPLFPETAGGVRGGPAPIIGMRTDNRLIITEFEGMASASVLTL